MKSYLYIAGVALAMGFGLTACSDDILDETPRAILTPDYFATEDGVNSGITALYSHLRNTWGQGYFFNALETGTDEYTYGQSADENFKCLDMTADVSKTKPDNCRADALWGNAFSDINTASGVIENGGKAGIKADLLAEAYFFRAFNYFELVQTFGGVPLDLGAGKLAFNTSSTRTSVRNTVPEVYDVIFSDLKYAVENLPEKPRTTGTVTKTTARFFLAKAYLTYAWWLQNPKGIDTYPTCTRDASKAGSYFQLAYDTALEAIDKAGDYYGLEEAYLDVFYGPNDRNKEILLYADHTAQDEYFNGGVGYGYGSGAAPDNFAHWMNRWNYTLFGGCLQRTAYQSYDRPWTRMATPCEVPAMFTDQNIDARFEGTFVTAFRVNWECVADNKGKEWTNANGIKIKQGDIALKFTGVNDANVVYNGKANPCAAGVVAGESAYVITPDHLSRRAYLNVWKNGYYNEKTWGDGTAGMPNGANPRPANIARFAELYFIAAEAAVKGATGSKTPRDLINVVRGRAGKWRLAPYANKDMEGGAATLFANDSAAMVAATPTDITIDYILDERFREFYGEGLRWWDLVRTQTWEERAKTYSIAGNEFGDDVKTYTRTIPANYYLRPIPQGQIDALQMSDEEKKAYQNPGYNN